ncbi:Crp/Fnr family transcriptional regulator [Streptococcus ovis]|uniref:Crp/Fnr family transcriptional regulator n=1 Tax=Streptococcus ovis TaxID=82806 RepID=UPI00035F87EC|nr:cyclic nucleotide-binding domain-containing protein [Streptococcus ovis]
MIDKEQYLYLRNHPAFSQLSIEHFDQLAKEIRFRRIPRDQVFFFAGDKRDYLFVLQKGYARIEQYDQTDTYSYLDYIREGGAFPFGGMFVDHNYHYTAIAMTDLSYFMVPMALYEQVSKKNIKQMLYLNQKLSRILSFQELRLRNAMISSASERVVQVLALLYWDMCKKDQLTTIPFGIHIQEISRLAATTRETTSHALKKLKADQKIAYSHKQLTYLDVDFFLENLTEAR